MTAQMTTLDNGLRIATDDMPGVETVSLGFWVGVGTRHEPEEANGVAHLVEHMLFKGTPTRTAFDISAQLENVGGHLNAYTTREVTAYHAKVLRQDFALATDVLSDMLLHATLDEAELERERGVIIQEIGQSIDQPDDIIFDHVQATCYPGSGLGRPILGTADIIKSLPRNRMQEYIGTNYAAGQAIFAAAGAVKHEEVVDLVQRLCAGMGKKAATKPNAAAFQSGDVREDRDIEQLHALITFKGLSYHDPDYYGISVLSTLLGGGMSSRLFQEVREKRGLVYSIYSYASAHADGGQFGIYAGTDPERINELLPVIAEELHKAAQDVTEDELKRAKAQLRASLFMAQESTGARAEKMAYNQLVYNRMVPNEEIINRIDAISREDMVRLMRGILSAPPVTGFVGPIGKVPTGADIAKRFAI
jgi:predicted Zn-dependent peptidase